MQRAEQRTFDVPGLRARDANSQLALVALQQKIEVQKTTELGAELVLAQAERVGKYRVGRRQAVPTDAVALEPFSPAPKAIIVDGCAHKLRKAAMKFDEN